MQPERIRVSNSQHWPYVALPNGTSKWLVKGDITKEQEYTISGEHLLLLFDLISSPSHMLQWIGEKANEEFDLENVASCIRSFLKKLDVDDLFSFKEVTFKCVVISILTSLYPIVVLESEKELLVNHKKEYIDIYFEYCDRKYLIELKYCNLGFLRYRDNYKGPKKYRHQKKEVLENFHNFITSNKTINDISNDYSALKRGYNYYESVDANRTTNKTKHQPSLLQIRKNAETQINRYAKHFPECEKIILIGFADAVIFQQLPNSHRHWC